MRLQIFSDLHFEAQADGGKSFVHSQDPTDIDVAILAGDISTPGITPKALKMFAERFKHVVFVRGNHELWGTGRERFAKMMAGVLERHPNVHWLQHDILELEGRRFLGATLWFKREVMDVVYQGFYGDFQRIPRFAEWVHTENKEAQEFLKRELKKGDIVITHHAPSRRSVAEHYKESRITRFYFCEMDELIYDKEPALWVHGHTHVSFDYKLGETRVVCNPFGYAVTGGLNPKYEERKIIEI